MLTQVERGRMCCFHVHTLCNSHALTHSHTHTHDLYAAYLRFIHAYLAADLHFAYMCFCYIYVYNIHTYIHTLRFGAHEEFEELGQSLLYKVEVDFPLLRPGIEELVHWV